VNQIYCTTVFREKSLFPTCTPRKITICKLILQSPLNIFTMKKNYLHPNLIMMGFFVLGFSSPIIAQNTVSYTVTGGNCAGTYTLTLSGTLNGKNTYAGSILGNTATIGWSGSRWEINTPFGIQFASTTETPTNPPCHTIGVFTSLGVCTGGSITGSSGSCSASTMPIELVSFTANSSNYAVELAWATASETNNKGFSIERSTDGIAFSNIDFVQSKGDSKTTKQYGFMDKNTVDGTDYYYRLRQIDGDGREFVSKIVTAKTDSKKTFSFAPNPANNQIAINTQGKKAVCRVYDILGRALLSTTLGENSYASTMDISTLKSGNYILEISANGGVFREKLMKY
jgi:Secretion system C-terminal sorting domain